MKELVNVLSLSIRSSDILGRYGGEEFIVIAPHTGRQKALVLAERLRKKVSDWCFVTAAGVLNLTISLGVGVYDGTSRAGCVSLSDHLLNMADEELYRAKREGRNRVSPSPLQNGGDL
ncbi:MAG: GGDEF domain-containing protein [Peptococcaceae bacterium]|nr:GGDEF domain-containing protein [Peptococcaceae bacterium]